jgi:tetratricopeptide (TPR) repeat protein
VGSDYVGHHVNIAARIADRAAIGEILVSSTVHQMAAALPGLRFGSVRDVALRGVGSPISVCRFVWDGSTEDDTAEPKPAAVPLVGRVQELHELTSALDRAGAGEGGLVLLFGEAGIGKTRLATELADRAASEHVSVHWGRCWEGGGAPAFWPWVQVVRSMLRRVHVDDLGGGVGVLARIVPELQSGEEPAASLVEDAEAARFALLDAVATTMVAATRAGPTAVIIEDLHWADRSSLLALRQTATLASAAPLLLVGTCRTGDREIPPDLSELHRLGRRVDLTGLGKQEVAELLERLLPERPPEPVSERVHDVTDGNPFFVHEVAPLASEQGLRAVPEGVRAAVRRRLDALPEDARDVVEVAAVLGRDSPLVHLRVATGLDAPPMLEVLGRATAAGVLRPLDDAHSRYGFRHALVREAVYEDLPVARRTELHARVGRALESIYGADVEAHLSELAHHFVAASAAGYAERAVDYARRAGDAAMAQSAYEDAAARYADARRALGQLEASDLEAGAELLLAEGTARVAALHPDGEQTLTEAADAARRLARPDLLARAAIALAGSPEANEPSPTLTAMLREAVATLPPGDSPLRARAMAELGIPLVLWEQDPAARTLISDAVSMAERVADRPTLVQVLWAACHASSEPARALELAQRLEVLAEEADDAETRLVALFNMALALTTMASLERAASVTDRCIREAKTSRLPLHRMLGKLQEASRSMSTGDVDAAQAHLNAATQELGRPDDPRVRGVYLPAFGYFMLLRGIDPATLMSPLQHGMSRGAGISWSAAAASVSAMAGDHDTARRILARPIPSADAYYYPLYHATLAGFGEACIAIGDPELAARVYEHFRGTSGRLIVLAGSLLVAGAADNWLGGLAAVQKRYEEAEQHFEGALALEAALEAPILLARTRFRYAQMLAKRAAMGDAPRAVELLDDCVTTATRLDIAFLGGRAAGLRERLGG